MGETIDTAPEQRRAVLVAVVRERQDERQANEYLDELEFLAETAGIRSVKRFTQRLAAPSAKTFIGEGKLAEIAAFVEENEIRYVIFDDELSPSQLRNLDKVFKNKIYDRTSLILDIFVQRATTAYAKAQVELAQCQYLLPRLAGMWTHLERQRGGTGTRGGAGEREIETDRRVIRNRISRLKEQLSKIDRQMAVQRGNRGSLVRVALVGYTNVGKSTLMNLIAKSEVFAENKLFATLDTTVRARKDANGKDDTIVYTGDIHAMWLRDSGAQVWPYLQLANKDEHLRSMLAGVIRRQFKCIELDPYANAFLDPYDPNPDHQWMSDQTEMRPELHERKWEIDSLCYPLRLAYQYWLTTGDASVFDEHWMAAIKNILKTFREQQRKEGLGPYTFMRVTDRQLDTVCNAGKGNPVNPVGLIASVFRPSDDATTFLFLVPSNFFAVTSLRKAAEILTEVNDEPALAAECTALAAEVETALKKYATYNHPEFGTIYAFEVDGFGNRFLMDDANVPSLLAMPYLGDMDVNDPIYQNTRRFVWSEANPYFFRGTAGEGIGGPHIGYDMAWPMSIMMKAFTSQDDAEIKRCVEMLMTTDAGTGFMHESFNVNDPADFTRSWFAWQNTLFGELILKLVNEGKTDLLNSIEVK